MGDSIGYKKPPRHTQFRPGESGNPGGRPARPRGLKAQIRRQLLELTALDGDPMPKVLAQEAIARALIERACRGDLRAIEMLLNCSPDDAASGAGPDDQDDALIDDAVLNRKLKNQKD